MRVSILVRVRWRILEWLIPFLFLTIFLNDIQPIRGAPQVPLGFSNPQRQQNPSFTQTGPFRIIPDEDDFEDIPFSPARQRNFGHGASTSFGVPLSSAQPGVRQESFNPASAHFGAPQRTTSGARSGSQQTHSSFGVPLSATRQEPSQRLSGAARSHFGVPLSATRQGVRQEITDSIRPLPGTSQKTSQAARAHFGVPLSATRPGSQQQVNQAARNHFGNSRNQPGSTFSIRRDSVEDIIDDVSVEANSHFSIPTHRNQNRNRFSFDDADDNISIEMFDKSSEFISLGRRFHPEGIPRLSDVSYTNIPSSARDPVISNPYIFTPDVASVDRDSLEDDDDFDDDTFIVLSPMVKAYNPSAHNERLSLSNDFLNQYNFVDVQGSTHWGYQTDSQYQDHKIHDSGAMEGKFGWTSPEGSEVNIKYIADEKGYRVLSSSGIYTREDEEVRRLKEQHFAEHEKARIHHQIAKAERNEEKTRVALQNDFKGAQGSSISGSGGFVIVPDEDDFPLIPSGPKAGVPLPTLTDTHLTPEPEVGVFIDSSVGVSLPTHSQDQNTRFGVPLPEPAVVRDQASPRPHSFGVPLPDPSLTRVHDVGVSLPDPTLSVTSGNQGFGVPLPGAGVPISDPTLSANQDVGVSHSDPTRTQKVGVPLPGSIVPGAQNFGVPLPDPTFSRHDNRGQSAPDSTFSSGQGQGVGVPLPGSTFSESFKPETTFSGFQEVGVPLPDPTLSGASGTGVTQQEPTFSRGSDSNLGVSHPDPTFIGAVHTGVPLPDPTFSGASRDQTRGSSLPASKHSETSRDSVVGVPLPDPTLSGTHKAGVHHPKPTFSDNQHAVPFPDSALPGFQTVGVPLPDPSLSGSQGVGIPLGETTFTGTPAGERVGVSLSEANQRSPHGGSTSGVSLPDHFLPGNQDFGIPLFDPTLTDHHGTIPQPDPTFTGNEAFGVPLGAISEHQATGPVGGPGKTSILFSDQNFGVPLSGGIDIVKKHREPSVVSERVDEASKFDSASDFKNRESVKSLSTNFDSSLSLTDKKSMSAGQELKVTFIDTKSSSDSTHSHGQKFGVPLSATINKDSSVDASQSSDHKDSTSLKTEEIKTPVMDPIEIFGLTSLSTDSSVPSNIATDTFPTEEAQMPTGFPISTKEISEPVADSIGVPLFAQKNLSSGINEPTVDHPASIPTEIKQEISGVPLFTQNKFSSGTSQSEIDSLTPIKVSLDTIPAEETQGTFGVPLSIQTELPSSKTNEPAEPSVVSSVPSDITSDSFPNEEMHGTFGVSLSILPESSSKTSDPLKTTVDSAVSSVVSSDTLPDEAGQVAFGVPLSNPNELTSSISETIDSSAFSSAVPDSIPTEDTQNASGVSLFIEKEFSPDTSVGIVDPTIPFKIVPETVITENIQGTFGVPLSVQAELPSSKFTESFDTTPIENTQDIFGTPLSIQPEFSPKKVETPKTVTDSFISSAVAPDALPKEDHQGMFGIPLSDQNELISSIIEPIIDHSVSSNVAPTIHIEDTQGTSGVSLFTENEISPVITEPVVSVEPSILPNNVPETMPSEKIQESFGIPLSILTELPSSKANVMSASTVNSPALSDVTPSEISSGDGTPLSIQPEFSSEKSETSKVVTDSSVSSVVIPDALPTEETKGTFGVPLSHQDDFIPSIIESLIDHSVSSDVAPSILTEDTQGTSGVSLFTENELSPVGAFDSSIPPKSVPEITSTKKTQESFGVPLTVQTEFHSFKTSDLPAPTVDSPTLFDVVPSELPIDESQGFFGAPLSTGTEISSTTGSEKPKEPTVDSLVPSDVVSVSIPKKETLGVFDIPQSISHGRPSSNVVSETFPTKETQTFGVPLSIFADILSPETSELPVEAVLPNEHNSEIIDFGAPLFSSISSLPDSSSVAKSSTKDQSGSALEASSQNSFQPVAHEQTIIPLEPVPLIPSTEGSLSQPDKKFFLVSDNEIAGGSQDFGVGLEEGPLNTLSPFNKEPLPTGGSSFGSLPNVGVPLGPVTFSGVDLLQGPPVEQLDPSFISDRFPTGLDPCLNSKIHPTLLPPHCANANVEPNQRIGKSLVPSSSKNEQPQDSFIVVVNSDIFQH